MDDRPGRRRLLTRFAIGVVLAGIALAVAVELAGGMEDAVDALRAVDARWLVPAAAAEGVSYALLSWQLRRLAGERVDLSRAAALRLGLVVYGFGLVTPASPAEGTALGSAELSRRGLSSRRALLTLVYSQWYANGTLWVIAAVAVLVAARFGDLPGAERAPLVAAAVTLLVALVVAGTLARRRGVAEWVAVLLGAFASRGRRKSVEERRAIGSQWHADATRVAGTRHDRMVVVTLALLAWAFDALCMFFAFVAAGVVLRPDVLLLTYTVAVIATGVPLLPAGIGVVETALPALLGAYGIDHATALAGALAYRGLGTFLPALVGAAMLPALRVVHRRTSRHRRQRAHG